MGQWHIWESIKNTEKVTRTGNHINMEITTSRKEIENLQKICRQLYDLYQEYQREKGLLHEERPGGEHLKIFINGQSNYSYSTKPNRLIFKYFNRYLPINPVCQWQISFQENENWMLRRCMQGVKADVKKYVESGKITKFK